MGQPWRVSTSRAAERGRLRRRWTRRVKAQDGMRKGRRDGTALRKAPAFSWEAAMKRTEADRLSTVGLQDIVHEVEPAAVVDHDGMTTLSVF